MAVALAWFAMMCDAYGRRTKERERAREKERGEHDAKRGRHGVPTTG